MKKFFELMDLNIKDQKEINMMSPLVLAYIGDALYEIYVRTYVIHKYNAKLNELHTLSTEFVKASAQAKIVHALEKELTEEERRIIRRGRNQKSGSVPKNASITDYRYATGFETLIGYLYLLGEEHRLAQIISKGIKVIENEKVGDNYE